MRRPMLSLEQRFEIAQHLESGVSTRRLAAEFDIHPTTVRRIRRTADLVTQFLEEGSGRTKRRNLRKPVHQELDSRLYAWILERKSRRESVTDTIMTEKAVELNKELGGSVDFKASRGWLWGFKNRHRIRSHSWNQKIDLNTVAAREFAERFTRQIEEEGVEYENIYNMNETGLVWKALPLKTKVQWDDRLVKVGKPNKDRVTVGFCTNATGSHKHAPLFIHRYVTPRVLKNGKHKLPVIYKAHEHAAMDRNVFTDWYENHFKPDVMRYQLQHGTCGKVMLVLDNSRGYTAEILEQFKNDERFEMVLLPPNTGHLIQPIDTLISKTRESYHYKMSNRVTNFSEQSEDFCANYDLRDCINLIAEAWSEISVSDITDAWRILVKGVPDPTKMEKLDDFFQFNQHVTVDSTNSGEQDSRSEAVEFLSGRPTTESNSRNSKVMSFSNAEINEEKISRAFETLMLWSKKESEMIEFNIECLKNYYYEQT
ncbi:PREDICTED: jerky protein homolog-like [Dufourea novaeangliae]|uniref:jerky protein homolog-like n=1 Tax=Dufourea novaeangliae TaxID=178035 RepID=UPI000767A311|nr:PREDICTED: jerky protein homolog-like [Dufourea novaeangliae]